MDFFLSDDHSDLLFKIENNETKVLECLSVKYNRNLPSGQYQPDWTPDDLAVILSKQTEGTLQNLIHRACEKGNLKAVQTIHNLFGYSTCLGTEFDLADQDHWTPFLVAVHARHYNIVEFVLTQVGLQFERDKQIFNLLGMDNYIESRLMSLDSEMRQFIEAFEKYRVIYILKSVCQKILMVIKF